MIRRNYDFRPQKLSLKDILEKLKSSPDFSFESNGNGGIRIRRSVESFHSKYGRYKYHEVFINSGLPDDVAINGLRKLLGEETSHDGNWAGDYALCYDYSSGNCSRERIFVVLEMKNKVKRRI